MISANKRAIRSAFDKAAVTYDDAAFLQNEVAGRLDERLEMMKLSPQTILDIGCGTGYALPRLRARYPKSHLLGLDLAPGMLRQARRALPQNWLGRLLPMADTSRFAGICADMDQLPLRRDSIDMAWSSLALQWSENPEATFREIHRVLRPGGLFAFATFGPDTLKELRSAFHGLDGYHHVNRFVDMHDLGDMLVYAGFANPVMEMEYLTLTYADLRSLLRELKAIGAHTVTDGRRSGLMGKQAWRQFTENYERLRRDGRLPATYEVVYGHAWAGRKDRLEDGRQVIQFSMAERKAGLR